MTATFLGSALSRCAATAYFVPVASRQDRFTAIHYNAVDLLVSGVTSHYVLKNTTAPDTQWIWNMFTTRSVACVAGVVATRTFSSRPISLLDAVTINVASVLGACAVALLSHHLFEKTLPCKEFW